VPPLLVDLEERLAADRDGSARAALARELAEAREQLRARLARGGTQEQYRRWSAAERALGAAMAVLEKVNIEPPETRVEGPATRLKGE